MGVVRVMKVMVVKKSNRRGSKFFMIAGFCWGGC